MAQKKLRVYEDLVAAKTQLKYSNKTKRNSIRLFKFFIVLHFLDCVLIVWVTAGIMHDVFAFWGVYLDNEFQLQLCSFKTYRVLHLCFSLPPISLLTAVPHSELMLKGDCLLISGTKSYLKTLNINALNNV